MGFAARFSCFTVEKCFYFFISALSIDSFRSNRRFFFYLSFLKFSLVENNNINSLSIREKFEKQILFIERLLVYFFILNFGFED